VARRERTIAPPPAAASAAAATPASAVVVVSEPVGRGPTPVFGGPTGIVLLLGGWWIAPRSGAGSSFAGTS
jgi:hypothetical protein